jgi:cold shock CspA family protein
MNLSNPRFNGKLVKWNADRGFGFVVADHGEQELFVHATAFPRDGHLPVVGEALTFEVELDKEGRKRAIRVRRPGASASSATRRSRDRLRHVEHDEGTPMGAIGTIVVAIVLVGGLAWHSYTRYEERKAALLAAPRIQSQQAEAAVPAPRPPGFRCDGRKHCSQMTSCSEAKLFLEHCPDMETDGDKDGIPCEQQWCTGPLGG